MEDHIVEEVRRIREEHAAQFNYDIDAIFADYKRLEAESKRKHISFGPRRVAKPMPPKWSWYTQAAGRPYELSQHQGACSDDRHQIGSRGNGRLIHAPTGAASP